MRAMIRFLNKWRITCGLLLWFIFVFLIAYFTWGPTIAEKPAPRVNGASISANKTAPTTLPSNSPALDSDNDGIPDAAELRAYADRDGFRRWFTHIAEMQYYRLSDQWNPEQRDCAGLVRFAWREALHRHDRPWFQKMGPGYEAVASDSGYLSGNNPLGEKLFRTDFGTYKPADVAEGRFSEFVDARALKNFNTVFVGRNRRQAQPGDLLIYYQPRVRKFPYHVMIFLGAASVADDSAHDWVVYHTGSSPIDQGTVKKVELKVLDHHPDPRWRPIEGNRNFLGFYRLKILD
jgi:hypothetical protein